MRTSRGAWALAGLLAGFAGLAASYCVAMVLTTRDDPVSAVAELVIRLTPGPAVERAIQLVGRHDKTLLVVTVLVLLALLFAMAGLLARRAWWAAIAVYAGLALVGAVAVGSQRGASPVDAVALVVGFFTWLACLALLIAPLTRAEGSAGSEHRGDPGAAAHTRRGFLLRVGVVGALGVTAGAVGRAVGLGRRQVEEARRLLRLPGVTVPRVPAGARVDVPDMTPWLTPADDFYRIDTAVYVPAIRPQDWQLRIHGLVDREIVLDYQQLIARQLTEAWVTICCVSNDVGGPLIGNAWWSGVRIADLLREAGVQDSADAVLQTSDDGWTCGTPLGVLTDDRDAMLAVAMNGEPLPVDHGFPVRTIVPGLYGYVSACKWVVDLRVTRFADISAYWTDRGWSELGPVKISSRIDVPRDYTDIAATGARVAGVAWAQHTGIERVEVNVDGGDWQPAGLGRVPSDDTWVQWAVTLDLKPGERVLRVRATGKDGTVQTGEVHGAVPDGATGWHTIHVKATD
ncbi:molybdopterin-dependent oxidoreductase [Nocardioides sp. URHA0032]|uniref:molybdopterin-dependent oxidoreductase n=1 Tax=Nocardioides sp. URHA0032 TaxID=1380388 RepID=UPI00048F0FDE|nr:molybdopterin-dependent oxidoreductase [Nocardioides sp. URHA0032]